MSGAAGSAVAAAAARAAGRRFGRTVGGAFALLAAIAWWRGHPRAAMVLLGAAATLLLGARLVPGRLGPVERAWMRLAHAISRVTTPVVLGAIWLLVVTPVGLLRRAWGANPLARRAGDDGYWVRRAATRSDLDRQF